MKHKRWLVRVAAVVAVLLIGYFDYITGYEFSFVLCYFVPIAIVAWYESLPVVLTVACMSGIVWYVSDGLSGSVHSRVFYRYWEGVVKVVTFVIVGRAVYSLRKLRRERAEFLHELAALLPICPRCHAHRKDQDYPEKLQQFLREHPEIPVESAFCDACEDHCHAKGGTAQDSSRN